MADTNAQAEIRGIDINKLVEGFAEEGIILKNFCRVTKAGARELRWYQKTAGFLTGPTTSGITSTLISNTSSKSLPVAIEPSYTRNTSYVKKYFAESPLITVEDLNDSDPDIWADMIKDIARAVNYQVDSRIYTVMTAGGAQTAAATQDGWDDTATGDPIIDLTNAQQKIRAQGYDTSGAVLYINSVEYKNLLNWIISVKGSSIPSFSSEKVRSGVLMELLGLKVVVSENATTDQAVVFIPDKAVVWKEFMSLHSAIVDDPGIGKKVRVWAEGEAIRPNPNAVFVITDTVT
jgi:hypothetical protein|tara:strand:+ start:2447 stop:3319 length:873 start_codon:yes stop_codon:yes gene_type:complete